MKAMKIKKEKTIRKTIYEGLIFTFIGIPSALIFSLLLSTVLYWGMQHAFDFIAWWHELITIYDRSI